MGKALRVLIIEDSEEDALLLLRELRRGGYEVASERIETAETMQAALTQKTWDLIVSDYTLPQFNAPQALQVLKASGLDLPFILISGTIGEETAVAALKAGASDFLVKGKFAQLGAAIERELREAESRRQRRQTEENLLASEVRYRRLFEAAKDGILILDAETGAILDVNPFLIEILGYGHTEFLGKQLWEIGSFKDIVANKEAFLKLQEERYIRYENLPLETKAGRRIWVEFVSNTYAAGDRQVIQCNIRDITERKKAQELIEQQLKRLNGLRAIDIAISSSFDLHVTLDILLQEVLSQLEVDAADVMLLNPTLRRLEYAASRGFRSTAIQNSHVKLGKGYAGRAMLERQVIHIPNILEAGGPLAEALLAAQENLLDYYCVPLIVKNEAKGVLEIYHRTALQPNQSWLDFLEALAGQAAIAIDNAQLFDTLQRSNAELEQRVAERTSDLSRANLELEHALRIKDEFLANMSHELRTPLNSIIGLSDSLSEQTAGDLNEKQQRYINIISESGHHLLELINDILDLAKIEAGQVTLSRDQVDIHLVSQSSLRMIRQLAMKKNQVVTIEVDEEVRLIWADERRLKQMLVNLLSNAVKFTPEGGKLGLEVHGDLPANKITISVWDNGIGIDPEDISKLFQPFIQLDAGLARENSGTGLGLALVAQMARLHGGSVSADSQPGSGSRFTISLPWESPLSTETISRLRIAGKSQEVRSGVENNRHTILMVEDNEDVVMVIRDYLEYLGYKVVVAHHGLEGIEQAIQVKPSLILMDVQMPGLDGLEATRRLRADENFKNTPIIALTALAMTNDRERCLAAGMNEYISKPVNLKNLALIIQNFLTRDQTP